MNTPSTQATLSSDKQRNEAIIQELVTAGVTSFGLSKFSAKYLPTILHPDEHIKAAIYGRYRERGARFNFSEGWLIATDRRVLFLDHKPGYTNMDEIGYDSVSGVQRTTAGWFSTVTLRTRVGNYTLRFTNNTCATNFIHIIETKRLEPTPGISDAPQEPTYHTTATPVIEHEAMKFLRTHDAAVLSTITRTGQAHGAVIYYLIGKDDYLYFLTKNGTQKAHNIFANKSVALTVFDKETLQTVQLQGMGEMEANQETKDWVFTEITKPRQYEYGTGFPPVTTLKDGAFMVIKVTPLSARYIDFHEQG